MTWSELRFPLKQHELKGQHDAAHSLKTFRLRWIKAARFQWNHSRFTNLSLDSCIAWIITVLIVVWHQCTVCFPRTVITVGYTLCSQEHWDSLEWVLQTWADCTEMQLNSLLIFFFFFKEKELLLLIYIYVSSSKQYRIITRKLSIYASYGRHVFPLLNAAFNFYNNLLRNHVIITKFVHQGALMSTYF